MQVYIERPPQEEVDIQHIAEHQQECPDFREIYKYKLTRELPDDPALERTIVVEAYNFELEDDILKLSIPKGARKSQCKSFW